MKSARVGKAFILGQILRGLSLGALVASGSCFAADWSQFRGGEALGVAQDVPQLPGLKAGSGEVVWRSELPGSGWSQPIVVGERIYVTTAIDPSGRRPKGMAGGVMDLSTMGRGPVPKEPLDWKLFCLDGSTGKPIWESSLAVGKPEYGKHASNTFATETPAASESAIYSFVGPLGILVATDFEGKELWRKEFGPQSMNNQFGTGSSPLLAGDRLVLQLFNQEYARIVCLSTKDGGELWRAEQPKGSAWSTPIIWDNRGTQEVIGAGQGHVIGYDLATGAERWRLGGLDTSFSCSVVADSEGLYFGTSSPGSRAPIYAIRAGQEGDLTLDDGETQSDAVAWSKFKSGAGMPSPVVVGDTLVFFGNTVVCYEKASGEELYRKRLTGGTLVAGCPVVVGDQIFVVNEDGVVISIAAGGEFKVTGEMKLVGSPDEVFWATPAVSSTGLLIRSSSALYLVR